MEIESLLTLQLHFMPNFFRSKIVLFEAPTRKLSKLYCKFH